MYNRYQGNSGRMRRVPDAPEPPRRAPGAPPPRPLPQPGKPPSAQTGGGLAGSVQTLLGRLSLADMETEDLLLILILYLMYRESGDRELLFILGSLLLS